MKNVEDDKEDAEMHRFILMSPWRMLEGAGKSTDGKERRLQSSTTKVQEVERGCMEGVPPKLGGVL